MTLVAAKKFGDRIMMFADTMISGDHLVRQARLPGRLKAIILTRNISVGYAGNSADECLSAVREAYGLASAGVDWKIVQNFFIDVSRSGNSDFILCAHTPDAWLIRIKSGQALDVKEAWIGDTDLRGRVADIPVASMDDVPRSLAAKKIGVTTENFVAEIEFTQRVCHLFNNAGVQVSSSVGGVLVGLLGSPYGHCYQGRAYSAVWDKIKMSIGVTADHIRSQQTGMTRWAYNTYGPTVRGIPLLGAHFPQLNMGFIYDPMNEDDAEPVRDISDSDFVGLLNARASKFPEAN